MIKKIKKNFVFLVSGPSGVGKTTVVNFLLSNFGNELKYSISYTTREKREGEVEGKDYFYIKEEEFKEKIEKGELIEWTFAYGHYYGTPRDKVEEWLKQGYNVLFDLDTKGLFNLKRYFEDIVSVFLFPPSWEELKNRLEKRHPDDPELVENRFEEAKKEAEMFRFFDYVIINSDLERTLETIRSIYISEKFKTSRLYLEEKE